MTDDKTPILLACLDVCYREDVTTAAGVWFYGSDSATVERQLTVTGGPAEAYQPGEFYRRELPWLVAVLAKGSIPDCVVIDGYVWLNDGQAGLGMRLYQSLDCAAMVVGVAKTAYPGASDVIPICRGLSRSPLFVSSVGMKTSVAATMVVGMHGRYRIPTMLKRVDQLARKSNLETGW